MEQEQKHDVSIQMKEQAEVAVAEETKQPEPPEAVYDPQEVITLREALAGRLNEARDVFLEAHPDCRNLSPAQWKQFCVALFSNGLALKAFTAGHTDFVVSDDISAEHRKIPDRQVETLRKLLEDTRNFTQERKHFLKALRAFHGLVWLDPLETQKAPLDEVSDAVQKALCPPEDQVSPMMKECVGLSTSEQAYRVAALSSASAIDAVVRDLLKKKELTSGIQVSEQDRELVVTLFTAQRQLALTMDCVFAHARRTYPFIAESKSEITPRFFECVQASSFPPKEARAAFVAYNAAVSRLVDLLSSPAPMLRFVNTFLVAAAEPQRKHAALAVLLDRRAIYETQDKVRARLVDLVDSSWA
jgi:hypothetical protein